MSKVYFMRAPEKNTPGRISADAAALFKNFLDREKISVAEKLPLKVHFGEKGNQTFIPPSCFNGLIDVLKSRHIEACFTETNALYQGQRQNRVNHEKLAAEHGFNQLPVIIADGDYGDDFKRVKINAKHFESCFIGKYIAEAEQLLVISHFKGHILAGFGGAVKQLAMGCAARGGKLAQHHNTIPKIKSRKCDGCGECAEKCPSGAITVADKATIDMEKCIGCASCMAVCQKGAIGANMLNLATSFLTKTFSERLAEYAYAAQKDKPNIYVNFACNITRGCDCEGHAMKIILPDMGIFVGTDPIAMDQACLDTIEHTMGRKYFRRGRHTLSYGASLGLGSMTYELVDVTSG